MCLFRADVTGLLHEGELIFSDVVVKCDILVNLLSSNEWTVNNYTVSGEKWTTVAYT